jgi:hypothetical protein
MLCRVAMRGKLPRTGTAAMGMVADKNDAE